MRKTFFACFVVACSMLVFIADQPRLRYQEYFAQCSMIFGPDPTTGRVNLAVIGSSRSMRGMQADVLSKKVADKFGSQPVIYDLSRSYRDMGHMLPFVEDLFARLTVDMLLVEYKETGKQWRHPNFHLTATQSGLIDSFRSRPSVSLLERLQEQVQLTLDRLSNRINKAFRGRWLRDCTRPTQSPVITQDPSPPFLVSSEQLRAAEAAQKDKWRDAALYEVAFNSSDEERNSYYVRQIIEAGHANDVPVFFYVIPRLYHAPVNPDFAASFEKEFGARLISLPAAELEKIYPEGYTDPTHMGWLGSDVYMSALLNDLPWERVLGEAGTQ